MSGQLNRKGFFPFGLQRGAVQRWSVEEKEGNNVYIQASYRVAALCQGCRSRVFVTWTCACRRRLWCLFGESKTIYFWNNLVGDDGPAMQRIVKEYNAQSDYKVVFQPINGGENDHEDLFRQPAASLR